MNEIIVHRALQPLSVSGVVDATLGTLRRSWVTLLALSVIGFLGVAIFAVAVILPIVAATALADRGVLAALIIGLALFECLLFMVVVAMYEAAYIYVIGATHLGGRPTLSEALVVGLRRGPALLVAELVVGLAVIVLMLPVFLYGFLTGAMTGTQVGGGTDFGGFGVLVGLLCCVSPLLLAVLFYLGLGVSFVEQTVVLEAQGPVAAISRSWHLVAGNRLRLIGYGLFLGLVQLVFQFFIRGPDLGLRGARTGPDFAERLAVPGFIVGFVGATCIGIAVSILWAMITNIAWTVLYFDIRHRKEGFGALPAPYSPEPPPPQLPPAPWEPPTRAPDPSPWAPPPELDAAPDPAPAPAPAPSPWAPPPELDAGPDPAPTPAPAPSPWAPPMPDVPQASENDPMDNPPAADAGSSETPPRATEGGGVPSSDTESSN